jgi:poly-gamma-glutamate capsule biosynthesis protein CapA/YwtB (metallophosphatase superfamily)
LPQRVPDARAGTIVLGLAGDTMLGRSVGEALATRPASALFAPEVVAAARAADLLVVNLECCVSTRGSPWPAPGKPFHFRAPPAAVEALSMLGVDCVTLANNHALDFGAEALRDTLEHLRAAGIAAVGAGPDRARARQPVVLEARGFRLAVVAVTDHPADFAASPRAPGVAHADLRGDGVPGWLLDAIRAPEADAVLVTPHWGPNMTTSPLPRVRAAARGLLEAGATLVAGHSAHVFHGVGGHVLYDLGDFVDDYATDDRVRNDLGLLFLVTLDAAGPVSLEALPLKLEYCHTRLAGGDDAEWVRRRFARACRELGTTAREHDGRLVVDWRSS